MALLCSCHRVADHQIARHVESGAYSMEAVQDACKAGTRCGGCLQSVEALVERLTAAMAGAGA
jgi:bacterioferritin-associated ferredoxin